MKYIKSFENYDTDITYKDLVPSLKQTFEKTGIDKHCYNGEMAISASGWKLDHQNGSIGITFWLMDDDIDINYLIDTAKEWAEENNLIAATYYKNGIEINKDPIKNQDWRNKAGQSSKFIYGFTFYKNDSFYKRIYTEL